MKSSNVVLIFSFLLTFYCYGLLRNYSVMNQKNGSDLIANNSKTANKKKIVIFTSEGGGGHMAATACLKSFLGDSYDIETSLIFSDVLGPLDLGRYISFSATRGEQVYNFFMQRKWNRTLNWMYNFGNWYYGLTSFSNRRYIQNYLFEKKPDLVISVVPLVNDDIISATDQPLIVVPTDLNVTTFIPGINKPQKENFIWCMPFNEKSIRDTLEPAGINEKNIAITGFPIRKDFFEPKHIPSLKRQYKVPPNKPVVMILMGAVGLQKTVDFAKELAKIKLPVHLLLCTGRNTSLKDQLLEIEFPQNITKTIIEHTPYISDLMAISDLLFTKSGSVTFCEAIYSNLPMLLDATSTILKWEAFNHTFAQELNFGRSIKRTKELAPMVEHLLSHPDELNRMRENLKRMDKKNGGHEIRLLVEKLS